MIYYNIYSMPFELIRFMVSVCHPGCVQSPGSPGNPGKVLEIDQVPKKVLESPGNRYI